MRIQKILITGALGLMLSASMAIPVSAHGHHHQRRAETRYPVCTLEDCGESGHHLHDGEYYCGYEHEDGYCDGSCRLTVRAALSVSGHGHSRGHGCH